MSGSVGRALRTVAESTPTRVRSALGVGAWLALTGLFAFGGVVLVGSATTVAAGPGTVSALATLGGFVAASAAAPTLARAVVVRTAERVEAAFDDGIDDAAASRRNGSYGADRDVRPTPCPCYG